MAVLLWLLLVIALVVVLFGLLTGGATVRAYDPEAMDAFADQFKGSVAYCKDAYEAADGADALVIVTEWTQFRKLELDASTIASQAELHARYEIFLENYNKTINVEANLMVLMANRYIEEGDYYE